MKSKPLYFSMASLLGVLCSLRSFWLFFSITILYLLFLLLYKRYPLTQILFIFLAFTIFFLSTEIKVSQSETKLTQKMSKFDIAFTEDSKVDGNSFQIIGNDIHLNEKLIIHYLIPSKVEKRQLEKAVFYDRICHITGEVKKPSIAKNPNEINYREYLYQKQIYWIVESKTNPLQKCTFEQRPTFLQKIKKIRFQGIKYLQTYLPSHIAAFSSALIYGDRSLMSPETIASFQKAGIIHLLAISGLHVTLLMGMLYYIGLRIGITKEKMTIIILLFLPVYAVFAGGAPSVVRSVIMIFLVMVSVKWKRIYPFSSLDSICLAFSLLLLFSPMMVFDVGFQLSFSVSFGIILSGPFILNRYRNHFSKMLSTSMVAQISGLPILLYHFYSISLASIFANLIFIPLFSFLLLPGLLFLFLLLLLFGEVPNFILNFFEVVIQKTIGLSEFFSQISFLGVTPGRPNCFFIILYLSEIILIFILWEKKARKRTFLILGAFLFLSQLFWNQINPIGEVTVIDVGQGDSILLHLPYGQGNFLIDTGGTLTFHDRKAWQKKADPFEVGKDIVVPYLKSRGITRIDKLILTHGDMDHIGGTFSILKEIRVRQILMSDVKEPSKMEEEIGKEAKKKHIPIVKISSGSEWKTKSSFFYTLSPEKNFDGVRNRGSITLYIQAGGLLWFFGGDLDQVGEEEIVKKYPNLSFDILKVGHHGSRTSSSEKFLHQYKPKIALISVGLKNRFGHPNREVLEKLKAIHSLIFRTDQQGAVTYRFFMNNGTFSTFLP